MTLVELIDADPDLRWRPREVDADTRHRILATLTGLGELYRQLDPHSGLRGDPDKAYAALLVWEGNRAVRLLPGVSPLAVALVREEKVAPHDESNMAELRAVVTREWLRIRLGVEKAS